MQRELSFLIPVRTVSENVLRASSWQARLWGQKKKGIPSGRLQKTQAYYMTKRALGAATPIPFFTEIRLVRLAPRRMDCDNLAGALKSLRDGLAKALEIDDGDPRIRWEYDQEIAHLYAVRVEMKGLFK